MGEVTKVIDALLNAASHFLKPSNFKTNKPRNVKAAIKCLFTALSFVLPPSREAEIRLTLGKVLLVYTENLEMAVEQLQKSYRLLQTVYFNAVLYL